MLTSVIALADVSSGLAWQSAQDDLWLAARASLHFTKIAEAIGRVGQARCCSWCLPGVRISTVRGGPMTWNADPRLAVCSDGPCGKRGKATMMSREDRKSMIWRSVPRARQGVAAGLAEMTRPYDGHFSTYQSIVLTVRRKQAFRLRLIICDEPPHTVPPSTARR